MEENAKMGGFGSAVLELFAQRGLSDIRIRQFGIPDHFIEHGAPDILRKLCGLTAEDFAAAARELLGRPQPAYEAAIISRA
jgi:1-deoxy-D-xylulose-5-phosphate synthase